MNNFSTSAVPPPPLFPAATAAQDYPAAQFSSTPPPRTLMQRPRFGFHAPSPYPRPRSSASKPNPGSGFDSIREESDNYFPSNNFSFPSPIDERYSQNQSQHSSFGNHTFNNYSPYNDSYESKNHLHNNMSYDDSYNKPDIQFPENYDTPGIAFLGAFNKLNTSLTDSYDEQGPIYSRPYKNANASNNRFSNANNSFSSQGGDSSYTTCPDGSFTMSPNYNYYDNQRELPTTQVSNMWEAESQFSNTTGTRRNFKGKNAAFRGNRTQKFSPSADEAHDQKSKRPAVKRKAPELNLRCELCGIGFTSQIPFEMHLTGAKHMKKLKAIEILNLLKSQGHAKTGDTENKVFHCKTCNVQLNGALQVQTHYDGNKHKQKLKLLGIPDAIDATNQNASVDIIMEVPRPSKPKTANQGSATKMQKLSCDICGITVNSDMQLQQHLSSKKHQAKAEGKPLPARKKRRSGSNPLDDNVVPIGRASEGNNLPKVLSIPDIKANFVKAENNE